MASEVGIISTLTWRESGTADALVSVSQNLFDTPTVNAQPQEVSTHEGNLRVRDGDGFNVRIHDWSLFAALNTLQIARGRLELNVAFAGETWQFDPANFTAVPVINPLDNITEVWIGATTAADDPTTTPADWTSLGGCLAGSQPEISINQGRDGLGLPVYASVRYAQRIQLLRDAATAVTTTLSPFQRGKARIALEHPDGTYLIINNVTVDYANQGNFGEDQFLTVDMNLSALARDITTVLTFPATPPDYLYGFDLQVEAVSTLQSDYLTIT